MSLPVVSGAPPTQLTPTGIFAEALGEANLRAGPGIEYPVLGQIVAGTRYQVIARHELVPWLLIAYPPAPGGQAWVFIDLVTVSGSLTQLPYITSTVVFSGSFTPVPPATVTDPRQAPTATLPAVARVYVEADAEINVRFGPGVDYPRIGQIQPGERFPVISRHALYPWLLIEFPAAPEGAGWVFADVVRITGDLYNLPVITIEQVEWPTLTPTPPFVVTAIPPWPAASQDATSTALDRAVNLPALGDSILHYLLDLGFVPEENRLASLFLLDLASGQSISLGRGIAYSGMSLIKIPILLEFYRQANRPADALQAETITNTMICSGNHTANELLSILGNGDAFAGAAQVTDTLHKLGLTDTFLVAPFKLGDEPVENRSVVTPRTSADQSRAEPDPFNQMTPENLGWLLGAIYQCAADGSGPLQEVFPGDFTPTECRQIILAMSRNQINVLTEAGVPAGTRVAHKHGWIDDTHGDAAIIFTPGGDFVLVMALHQPQWLPYEVSWPAMAEITRMIYNAYNPDAPLNAIHPETVDETCRLEDNPLLDELQRWDLPPIN
ncbi:MAG: SH3 domain-containing protein [Anaerolineae bacterium]|nr:SH3 domain-containing protein [Anaerolineae bacterium]